ncbi:hypothetical protein EDC05_000531 [Coemansia umbellata]|uniref:Nucleotidylyl transferase n=1 Tax=Coemansia umbellata TaxID=1424467 RepID=A0ABQ8PUD3_9FUNG|nr:hypothetical protein EDC05_000531 [Coemansia umbellata]
MGATSWPSYNPPNATRAVHLGHAQSTYQRLVMHEAADAISTSRGFKYIELWSNGSLLMTISSIENVNIRTVRDLKRYVQKVTRVSKESIIISHGPTSTVYENSYQLPCMRMLMFDINILRVYFHVRHSARSEGMHMLFVCSDNLIKDECKRHGLNVINKFILCKWHMVNMVLDTFRSLSIVNGDTFYIGGGRIRMGSCDSSYYRRVTH